VPVMNCDDAREAFSALSRNGMGLTEWVLAEAHARQCAECRKEREYLQQLVSSSQRVAPQRALLHRLSKMRPAIHFGTSRIAAWVTQLRVLLAISLTVSRQVAARVIEASRVGATWLDGLLTRVRWLLRELFELSMRALASAIRAVGLAITHVVELLARLRSSLMVASQWTARAALRAMIGATRSVIAYLAPLVARLRVLPAISFTVSAQAASRVIDASRVEAARAAGLLTRVRRLLPLLVSASERTVVKAIRATGIVGRIVSRAISSPLWPRVAAAWTSGPREPSTRTSTTSGTRALLRACTGIVSLAVVAATIPILWPLPWPVPRPSTGERFSEDVRPPADRNPAEFGAGAHLVKTAEPKPVSAPQPLPAMISPPETRSVPIQPKPRETQAEIPAPWRSPEPAPAPASRVPGLTPTPPTEAAWSRGPARPTESARSQTGAGSQNAETSDPFAVIDWLLERRQ
jgi:hypothetical protein